MPAGMYDRDLDKCAANYVPLTPLSFLERAAAVYPDKTAVIHGEHRYSYREFRDRCHRLASALAKAGVGVGDTVAVLSPNIPATLEAHYGVPMAGAVLNAQNTRLDAATVAFCLNHAQAKVFIVEREWVPIALDALAKLERKPLLVEVNDAEIEYAAGAAKLGGFDYEEFLAGGDPSFVGPALTDEWQAISLNYTSGTTGDPKGVVYHHRGAYLNAIGDILTCGLNRQSVYLWTLPMFHCNGWCFTFGVTAACGIHVCLRKIDPAVIYPMIKRHSVTHMCGAPIIMNVLANAPASAKIKFDRQVEVITGGAAPPSAIIEAMESSGFHVTHLYGLTETYGPATVCAWQSEWDGMALTDRSRKMARQGVPQPTLEAMMVADPESMAPVPADGATIGELMLRSNTVVKGYLKNPKATAAAFRGGWFHTGDLAVCHPDGYVEIKDRSKDIIISGGENISSLEIEETLYRHPKVLEAAVVARPDSHWGETPCAFVTLRNEVNCSAEEIITFCRSNMAHFKAPRTVVFGPLPKTSTGKIQKFVLREQAKNLSPAQ